MSTIDIVLLSFLALIIFFIVLFIISYRIKYDTIVAFTGGLGSGKSLISVKLAVKLLKKQRFRVRVSNFKTRLFNIFHRTKKPFLSRPLLYSSIPVCISKKEKSIELTNAHLTCGRALVEKSIVYIDEIGAYCSQWDYNACSAFNEFIRLFRHYTKGGYLVCNDQASSNIVKEVRTRINQVFNLMHFKKFLFFFYSVKVRNISISEDITTIEEQDTEDNMTSLYGVLPRFRKLYDTYCYSDRYKSVPFVNERIYPRLKKNKLMKIDKQSKSLTNDTEKD